MSNSLSSTGHIPQSTYRLQLTPNFGFADARALIPYLDRLGISDIYCSPILSARPGSTHGYDVIDPLHISPELGGMQEFEQLAAEAKRHHMSLLIDIVPNHMAASIDNPWWYDVLENGASSRYAHFFDIEWDSADPNESLNNRVLLPILGAPYGETLENGEIQLETSDQGYFLRYYEHRLPLALESFQIILERSLEDIQSLLGVADPDWLFVARLLDEIAQLPRRDRFEPDIAARRRRLHEQFAKAINQLRWHAAVKQVLDRDLARINGRRADPRSYDLLDRIVRRQTYRLAYWQIAREQINYRRFFDINDLVSLRVEDDDVFEATHQRILDLVQTGQVSGLRIDHIDGLWDPARYLHKLKYRLDEVIDARRESAFVVVEKILAPGERLPKNWPVQGTTGYDALNLIGDIFVDPVHMSSLEAVYRRVSGISDRYAGIVYRCKKLVLESTFTAYVRGLTFQLESVSNGDRHGRDLTFDSLQQALIETTATLPVYRTYISSLDVTDHDRAWIEQAITEARSNRSDLRLALDFLARVLTLNVPGYVPRTRHPEWLDLVMHWQQLCGSVMAKGNEDTALYRYFPLSSRNDVGGQPDLAPLSLQETNSRLQLLGTGWPQSMIATSTHDTKRSEDVRARIAVLSECPDAWGEKLQRWQQMNADNRATRDASVIPDGNLEYLIYQTMIGAWPLDSSQIQAFQRRLRNYVIKAVREAKEHSNWVEPDTVYEDALCNFIDSLFNEQKSGSFLDDFLTFHRDIARLGALNSLSQTALKLTAPGIPDIYQGTELWNFSLVDPDNRRQVDFVQRAKALDELGDRVPNIDMLSTLTSHWQDGRIKLYLIQRLLQLRRCMPNLFAAGSYTPLAAMGERRENVFSYVRTHDQISIIVVAPRLCSVLVAEDDRLSLAVGWGKSMLELPNTSGRQLVNLMTGEAMVPISVNGRWFLALSEAFRQFPVGVFGEQHLFDQLNSR